MNRAADAILIFHFLYILGILVPAALIPVGWSRGWRWVRQRRLRVIHLAMLAFVVLEVFIGMRCPLTVWENQLLASSGRSGYEGDFVAHWMSQIMYWQAPPWIFGMAYSAFLAFLIWEWWRFRPTS